MALLSSMSLFSEAIPGIPSIMSRSFRERGWRARSRLAGCFQSSHESRQSLSKSSNCIKGPHSTDCTCCPLRGTFAVSGSFVHFRPITVIVLQRILKATVRLRSCTYFSCRRNFSGRIQQNVDQLRKLIKFVSPNEMTYSSDSIIANASCVRPPRFARMLRNLKIRKGLPETCCLREVVLGHQLPVASGALDQIEAF